MRESEFCLKYFISSFFIVFPPFPFRKQLMPPWPDRGPFYRAKMKMLFLFRERSTPISSAIVMRKESNAPKCASRLTSSRRRADKTRMESKKKKKMRKRRSAFRSQKPWDFSVGRRGNASIFCDGAKGGYMTVCFIPAACAGGFLRAGGVSAHPKKGAMVKHRRFWLLDGTRRSPWNLDGIITMKISLSSSSLRVSLSRVCSSFSQRFSSVFTWLGPASSFNLPANGDDDPRLGNKSQLPFFLSSLFLFLIQTI